jgi:hypothetical protein
MAVKKQNTKKIIKSETMSPAEPVLGVGSEQTTLSVSEIISEQTLEPKSENVQDTMKQLPKAGRTILVKSKTSDVLDLSKFDNLNGLLNKSEINQHNSLFLTFDTIANAETAFNLISSEYNVKYSYYKIFFTLSANVDNSNYEEIKNEIMNFIETNTNSSMLYCKFYRKNASYMNCGDLIIDSIEVMNNLISKESKLKQFKLTNMSGTFYRFNNSKYKTPYVQPVSTN